MEDKAIQIVEKYFKYNLNTIPYKDSIFIVWSCYILGNRKYMIGTSLADYYFEVTYNKNKNEWYLDVYDKIHNEKITE